MIELLIDFFIARPGRLTALGRILFHLGATTLLFALCGRIATIGVSTIQGLAGGPARDVSLALLYPTLPTWWVPEGFPGYFTCIATIALGLALVQTEKVIDRAIR